ncbi:MAG TPA: mechanosensitive ion channel family protein [Gammaproteobacteria bacterium]|nr:mechanosensitive ion channel family protein [Longimicrobiaceae bacterium]HET7369785.1 mechanosensitive ion channel family protein [Gammaproteobacteria bacterium]
MLEFLDWTFYANPLRTWLIALVTACLVYGVMRFAIKLILDQLKRFANRTNNDLDNIATRIMRDTRWWFEVVVALWAGSLLLILPEFLRNMLGIVTALVTIAQLGVWGNTAIKAYVQTYGERKAVDDAASVTTIRAVGFLARLALWTLLLLVALDTLGMNVTALVAGLGIGGIAIALAAQNILGDLFASLSIVLDKPFVYGDFIQVDKLSGTVENVGLKTTRVRSITGEQLVFANSDLLTSRIHNYKRMLERRASFSFGVTYQTSQATLKEIPEMIQKIIEAQPDTRFDRAHLKDLGPSALNFEVVYYLLVPDYSIYMDRQQAINLEMLQTFQEEQIRFAHPTQTVFMAEA